MDDHSEKACETCRRRHVKCDKSLPLCKRCEKRGQLCPGYDTGLKILDEGPGVRSRYGGFGRTHSGHRRVPRSTRRRLISTTVSNNENVHGPGGADLHSETTSVIVNLQTEAEAPSNPQGTPQSGVSATTFLTPGLLQEYGHSPADVNDADIPLHDLWPDNQTTSPSHIVTTSLGNSNDYQQTARLVGNWTGHIAPHSSASSFTTDEEFFDLDIESYYANGNNACGFIPGVPVILSDIDGHSEDDLLSNSYSTLDESSVGQTGESPEVSRNYSSHSPNFLDDRSKETALLVRHFATEISPWMDLFDLDMYFSRFVPQQTARSLMLRSAVAAVSAKQIGCELQKPHASKVHHVFRNNYDATDASWFYKAASYYDKGISALRNYLHRSPHVLARMSGFHSSIGTNVLKGKTHTQVKAISEMEIEELMTAISVFSLYESLQGYTFEWSQHLQGFQSLLSDQTSSPLDTFKWIKGGRAAFWNMAHSDCIGAFHNNAQTQLDPANIHIWQAAGLQVGGLGIISPPDNTMFQTREDVMSFTLIWIMSKVINLTTRYHRVTTPTPMAFPSSSPRTRSTADEYSDISSPAQASDPVDQWRNLRELLQSWHRKLPSSFQPYAIVSYPEKIPTTKARFQRLFYSIPMCAAALHLYHFAQLLLLLHRPAQHHIDRNPTSQLTMFRSVAKKCDYHCRQICGIALGEPTLAVRRQLPQALYLAGLCFEDDEDRATVLELLENIERDTNVQTKNTIQSLKAQWGRNAEDII
ncbi:hypothetical protein F5884DRAFT_343783 [Xylogone sp. PMI_703]|nr:hypothetical protein F5884DRAFT_343783 [Xylogone sp. PMI_703]